MFYLPKKASALLITILMLALVSSVVLVTSRGVIISTRLSSSTSASDMAEQMAESGIQEGLAWYKANSQSPPQSPLVEYGNLQSTNSSYSLAPIFRGFELPPPNTNSSCSTISSAGVGTSDLDTNCPYYSLVVRNNVSLNNVQSEQYNLRQLPNNKTVNLYFPPSTLSASIQLFAGDIGDGNINVVCGNNSGNNNSIKLATNSSSLLSDCNSPISITVNDGNQNPSSQDIVLTITNNSTTSNLLISKGYTTIESTGYAGGIISKRLVSIYPNWNPNGSPPYIIDQTTSKTLNNNDGL